MSNHDNNRRGEKKRTEHGSTWERKDGSAPSVAHARKSWKKIGNRQFRRTGTTRGVHRMAGGGRLRPPPDPTKEE